MSEQSSDESSKRSSSSEKSSSPKRVCLDEALTCQLCAQEFRWPAISCNSCKHVFCEECVSGWGTAKNGGQEQVPCPNCRKLSGFERNEFVNRHVGQRQVKCPNNCGARFAACDRDEHLNKYCGKRTQRCVNATYGCPWMGVASHTHDCIYAQLAASEKRFDQKRTFATQEFVALQQKVEALKTQIRMESDRGAAVIAAKRQELELFVKSLSTNERCREFVAPRRDGYQFVLSVALGVTGQSQLQFRVQLDDDSTYQLYGSLKNAKSNYPVTFYCLFINQEPTGLSVINSVKAISGRFMEPNKEQLMFSERDTLLPKHGELKKVHIRIGFTAL